ncbi:MAG: membrane dipeptidase [Bacillota bacterium]|nr:membrane dipeptidase [Bacillota bacterium]
MKQYRYSGYRSFQYLEPGVDYKAFRLAKELDRVPSTVVPVTPEEEARVWRLLQENLVIDLHEHAFVVPDDVGEIFEYRRWGRDWTGYEGLTRSGIDVVFDNMMDGTALVTSRNGWKWDDVVYDIGMRLSDIHHQDFLVPGLTLEDLTQAKKKGQIAFVISLESATMIENELDRLDILYGLGVRCIGIAYSEANSLGAGLREARDGGLTQFGREAVRRMNQLGLAIDVSHSGDQTALDTVEVSEKPVFITHAGARALWNSNRLKPDDVIKAVAQKGGVIGIEAAPNTTLTHNHPRHSLESVMEHFEYCANLVGIDHVAFGPDTMFGDHVGLHHAFAAQLSIGSAHGSVSFEEVPYVDGLENPGDFPNIVRWLVKHGYKDEEIAKAIGGNVWRVLQEVWYR